MIMADQIAPDQPDLSALTGSPGQKRKRDSNSPDLQRAKRPAPPATMSASAVDTAAFIENAIEATHAAAAANGVNVADFNALQQAAAADHTESSDPSNATSTAQAALGMYPTLHVPPSTEEQFAAQAGEPDHGHDNAFNPDVTPPDVLLEASVNQANQQQPPNGVPQQPPRYSTASSTPNPKPSVGSEEWHKMRKDNHKEGEQTADPKLNCAN
jgi:bHLH factor